MTIAGCLTEKSANGDDAVLAAVNDVRMAAGFRSTLSKPSPADTEQGSYDCRCGPRVVPGSCSAGMRRGGEDAESGESVRLDAVSLASRTNRDAFGALGRGVAPAIGIDVGGFFDAS